MPAASADEGVLQAFHILNQFDIPGGLVRDRDPAGNEVAEYTQWTSVADLTNRRYFYRTYDDQTVRMIDLKNADLEAGDVRQIPPSEKQPFEDVTSRAR